MWFEVEKEGLAKLLERKGKAFALYELLQNAWDQDVKKVKATIERPAHGYGIIRVEDDDPEGFANMNHAWTLFAESAKKDDPNKRGRFNLGEKLVLAICRFAEIKSVKGAVRFDDSGRHTLRKTREQGSEFSGDMRMTVDEYEEILEGAKKLIPPEGIETEVNGIKLVRPKLLKSFDLSLPTEKADEEGVMRRMERKTLVEVYDAGEGKGIIYELGIPIVETSDKYHVNVMQKVPLNMERDNVHPSYLRKIRTAILDQMYQELEQEDVNQAWVRDGIAKAAPEAVKHCIETRFGENAVIYDPSDPEANKLSVIEGRNVVKGPMLSAEEWERVRENKIMLPAGQVTPSPKPYSDDPNADPEELIERKDWTEGMLRMEAYAKWLGFALFGRNITVRMTRAGHNFTACYGKGQLTFNITTLGKDWFDSDFGAKHDALLIHEFTHEYEGDHFSKNFYRSLCRMGSEFVELSLKNPQKMKEMKSETTA